MYDAVNYLMDTAEAEAETGCESPQKWSLLQLRELWDCISQDFQSHKNAQNHLKSKLATEASVRNLQS